VGEQGEKRIGKLVGRLPAAPERTRGSVRAEAAAGKAGLPTRFSGVHSNETRTKEPRERGPHRVYPLAIFR